MRRGIPGKAIAVGAVVAVVGGCGSSGSATSSGSSGSSPVALSAEAKSAASGDIPDNQVFVTLHDAAAGYSMQYPEGWVQGGSGADVTLRDKSNVVHIVVRRGRAPRAADAAGELNRQRGTTPSLHAGAPSNVTIGGASAVKVSYSTRSAPNPVTGKPVLLLVDRYVLSGPGRYAVADLGTPKGVDNVDAYRMMIGSFRWR
jgi:hypothetical protein